MSNDLVLALFIMAVGLSVAGVGAHLYQFILRAPAMLSYTGKTYLSSLGNLFISFVCGPYIMLNLGFNNQKEEALPKPFILLAALISFGWAFITGLMFMNIYLAFIYA
ncbi:MAG: hypothetical protein L3J15_04500 [Devosiaceae bacterium]|nr:hypothetical protein [Devosiaceae bacterium]